MKPKRIEWRHEFTSRAPAQRGCEQDELPPGLADYRVAGKRTDVIYLEVQS